MSASSPDSPGSRGPARADFEPLRLFLEAELRAHPGGFSEFELLRRVEAAGRAVRQLRERMARAFACRAAIKSGQSLNQAEMQGLTSAASQAAPGSAHLASTVSCFTTKSL